MSNLQIIAELCDICELQSRIIRAKSSAMEQMGAAVMEEEKESAKRRLNCLIGVEEAPDDLGAR